ncbi:hypothetical protein Tco_1241017 [Tanacetum coccineum]
MHLPKQSDPVKTSFLNKIDDFRLIHQLVSVRRIGKEELSKADLEGLAFMMVKGFHENNISLQFQMEECHKLLTNQIDLVNPEGHRIVPDISNPLPLGGPPSQKAVLLNIHYKPSDRDAVRSHMRILSVISMLDTNPKQDKVNLHNAVSLWTRNIVIRKRVEDLQLGIESYQTKLNLEQPNWDASDFPFKEDYTIVFKPRAVIYRDRDDNRKMMRIDEVHKFSDGTLTRIKEKLDFMVKDFKLFKFNKGMENRKWTEDDKRRSEDFIEVIERRLKIRRIFRSLESFVGGRLRDIDYRLISRTEFYKMEMEMGNSSTRDISESPESKDHDHTLL